MNLYKLGSILQQLYGQNIYNCYVGTSKHFLVSFIEGYYQDRDFILSIKPNGDVVIEDSFENSINTLYAHYLITDTSPVSIDKAFDSNVHDIINKIRDAYQQYHNTGLNP